MDPKPISIHLNLISCKDLQAFNYFQKLTLYAVVSIDSTNPTTKLPDQHKQQQRTHTHRDPEDGDGTNPEWNHQATFHLGGWVPLSSLLDGSRNDLFFKFEFRHDGIILFERIVGECHVPILDLVKDATACGGDVARFVSYEIRNGEGKGNGIFNFSYRVTGVEIETHGSGFQFLEGRISGYPVVDSDLTRIQYPRLEDDEIEKPCCYPKVECCSPSPPPFVSSPSYGGYNYYYPPPPQRQEQPPYRYPPPAPVYPPFEPEAHPWHPHFGPEAHPWPPGPSFEHRW
ncbi:hypothetical protein RIF29_05116 [Crotalaria pallida]|uniref:C2 domain-containing protein n=1 Tax=Crotalaria pallida TaxID=3830 RepID=A0AAN9J1Q5_CROPI